MEARLSAVGPPDRGLLGAPREGSLELEQLHLGGPGQVATAAALYQDHVLDPHRTPARIVEPGLHGHHVAGPELGVDPADAGHLVDVEPDAVPGPVEEPLVPSVDHARHVAARLERPVDLGVDGGPGGAVPDQLDAPEL